MSNKPLVLIAALMAAASVAACSKSDDNGAVQKTTGKIESAAGDLTGSADLKQEGQKDQVVGGVKGAVSDIKDSVKAATK